MLKAGDIGEGRIAFDGFEETVGVKSFAFGFEHVVEERSVGATFCECALAKGAEGFFFGEADEIFGELRNRRSVESARQTLLMIQFRENPTHSGGEFFGAEQTK